MNRIAISLPLTIALLVGAGCSKKSAAKQEHQAHEHEGGEAKEGESARLPLKEIRGLRFMEVPEPKAEGAWYPAEAIGDESAQAMLTSPVKGIVSSILIPPGRHVGAGTGLLVLQSPELARLKADWLSAMAKRERTDAELAREQRLFNAEAGSRRELELARSEASTAKADEEAARLALEARGVNPEAAGATLTVRALKAGSVTAYKTQLDRKSVV